MHGGNTWAYLWRSKEKLRIESVLPPWVLGIKQRSSGLLSKFLPTASSGPATPHLVCIYYVSKCSCLSCNSHIIADP